MITYTENPIEPTKKLLELKVNQKVIEFKIKYTQGTILNIL